jgi:hypothetical protein
MTKRRTTLLVLSPYPTGHVPGQRFRIEQWEQELQTAGIDCIYAPGADPALMQILFSPGRFLSKALGILRGGLRQRRQLERMPPPDLAMVFRAASLAGPPGLERTLARRGIPFILDFDDAIFILNSSPANRWLSWLKFPGKTKTLCELSAHVTVGNAYLANWAKKHNQRVTVIPSSVDLGLFPTPRRQSGDEVVVGWTGSHTSQAYLEEVAPMLGRFLTLNPRARLRVHSDRPPVLAGIPHEWRAWDPATEAEEISAFDIGIMPMHDDLWSRGKCSMKALLYMAAGSVAVCSPVGHNTEVIQDDVNGVLAAGEEEWVTSLSRLANDARLRERLGTAGRLTVENRFSKAICGQAFAAVVHGVVAT